MSIIEARNAVKTNAIIYITNEYDRWGIAESLSDDESIIYYSPKGTSLSYLAAKIESMSIQKVKDNER